MYEMSATVTTVWLRSRITSAATRISSWTLTLASISDL